MILMKKIYALVLGFLPLLSFGQYTFEWHTDSIQEANPGADVGFDYTLTNPGTEDIDITWIFTRDTSESQEVGVNVWQDYMCEGILVCWPYTKRSNTFTLPAGQSTDMYHHIWMMRGDEGDTGTFHSQAIIYQANDSANTVNVFNITVNIVPVDTVFSTIDGKDVAIVDGDTFELFGGNWVPLGVWDDIKAAGVLGQNAPNPFQGQTNIEYSLTSGMGSLKVQDLTGKIVMDFPLNQQNGIVTLQGQLEAGVYFYSLWEDGRMLDSKRMQVIR